MGKVIISCAITGSIHTLSMSPHLPVTPAEIAESALEATEAGGDRPSPRPQSRGWPTRPESGGVRAVPQGDPGELRSPRRDRDRRLEGLYARGASSLPPIELDDARRFAMGRRRSLRLSRRSFRRIRDRRNVDGGRRGPPLWRNLDHRKASLFQWRGLIEP
jgi:hypothetical protein